MSGGSDSLIVFWDMYELLSSGTISTNDYQVRKLDYNSNGDYLAAIFYDEILKKWQVEVYGKNRQICGFPLISLQSKTSIAWHPKNP